MEHGFVCTSLSLKGIRWIDEQKKNAFYQSIFSEDELLAYKILQDICFRSDEYEYALDGENLFLLYQEELHDQLVHVVEQLDPTRYRQLRLPLITGSYVDADLIYTRDVAETIDASLYDIQHHLLKILLQAIEKI